MREVMFSFSPTVSSRSRSSGNSGVRSSKRRRAFASSASRPETESMRSSAGYFSLLAAGRQAPSIVSPLRSEKRFAWLIET